MYFGPKLKIDGHWSRIVGKLIFFYFFSFPKDETSKLKIVGSRAK